MLETHNCFVMDTSSPQKKKTHFKRGCTCCKSYDSTRKVNETKYHEAIIFLLIFNPLIEFNSKTKSLFLKKKKH
jgi:hypothetical protein